MEVFRTLTLVSFDIYCTDTSVEPETKGAPFYYPLIFLNLKESSPLLPHYKYMCTYIYMNI